MDEDREGNDDRRFAPTAQCLPGALAAIQEAQKPGLGDLAWLHPCSRRLHRAHLETLQNVRAELCVRRHVAGNVRRGRKSPVTTALPQMREGFAKK